MSSTTSTTPKIMVIRHAEKPYEAGSVHYHGVTLTGEHDKESLIAQGWQRAGALAVLFAPFAGPLQNAALATPALLFAAADPSGKSERPVETITPLSLRLGLTIDDSFGKKDYADMVAQATQQDGPVLICWQHQDIPSIAGRILPSGTAYPSPWPGDRFDLVWVFDLDPTTGTYALTQVPQNLLAGDLNTTLPI